MSNTLSEKYEPIGCDHKIPDGKYKGFSAYQFLSESSGSGPNIYFMHHISFCALCGEIKVGGFEMDEKGFIHRYNQEFSIHHPEAVAAIVKLCNYMNKDTEGYIPFKQDASNK